MFKYSLKSIGVNKGISFLFLLAICIVTSISMLALNISSQIQEGLFSVDKKYDLIVGPVGSDSQLLMSSLFFSEKALGTIDAHYLDEIGQKYSFQKVIPLAMGDSINGQSLIGSTQELLSDYVFSSGRNFETTFELVIGSSLAERYNLKVGSQVVSSHGVAGGSEDHENTPYTVVGVLSKTNTAYDTTAFTTVESIWEAHEHIEEDHDEVEEDEDHEHEQGYTSILIRSGNLSDMNLIQIDYDDSTEVQVVLTTQSLRKLATNIDLSKQVALLLCGIIIVLGVTLTSIMCFLILSNLGKEIDTLIFLGFTPFKVQKYTLYQLATLTICGMSISTLINKLVLHLANTISTNIGLIIDTSKVYSAEVMIMLVYTSIVIVVGAIYTYFRAKKGEIQR